MLQRLALGACDDVLTTDGEEKWEVAPEEEVWEVAPEGWEVAPDTFVFYDDLDVFFDAVGLEESSMAMSLLSRRCKSLESIERPRTTVVEWGCETFSGETGILFGAEQELQKEWEFKQIFEEFQTNIKVENEIFGREFTRYIHNVVKQQGVDPMLMDLYEFPVENFYHWLAFSFDYPSVSLSKINRGMLLAPRRLRAQIHLFSDLHDLVVDRLDTQNNVPFIEEITTNFKYDTLNHWDADFMNNDFIRFAEQSWTNKIWNRFPKHALRHLIKNVNGVKTFGKAGRMYHNMVNLEILKHIVKDYRHHFNFDFQESFTELEALNKTLEILGKDIRFSYMPNKVVIRKSMIAKPLEQQSKFTDMLTSFIMSSVIGKNLKLALTISNSLMSMIVAGFALVEAKSTTLKTFLSLSIACNLALCTTSIFEIYQVPWDFSKIWTSSVEKLVERAFMPQKDSLLTTGEELQAFEQQSDESWTEIAERTNEGYMRLKQEFGTPTGDVVSIIVSMLSWLISCAAVFACRHFGQNIADMNKYVTFFNSSRTLQINLRKDIGGVEKMIRNFLQAPDEHMLDIFSTRLRSCEKLLSLHNIDIATDLTQYYEWKEILQKNKDLLAMPLKNDGLKSIRMTLSKLHCMMMERSKDVDHLATHCGVRVNPLGLLLWSSIGGIGKSTITVKHLVPHINKVCGAPDGTQIHLKLSEQNKYFPQISYKAAALVIDEFLAQGAADPFIPFVNGIHSPTPIPLDGAFDKVQYFNGKVCVYLANSPGCGLSGEPARYTLEGQEALWGRLKNFFVINLSRPVNQPTNERQFTHASDGSDLLFIPGEYIVPRVNKKNRIVDDGSKSKFMERAKRVFSPEDMMAISRQWPGVENWFSKPLDGRYWFTLKDLTNYMDEELEVRFQEFETAQEERRKAYQESLENTRSVNVSYYTKLYNLERTGEFIPENHQKNRISYICAKLENSTPYITGNRITHLKDSMIQVIQEKTEKFGHNEELWSVVAAAALFRRNFLFNSVLVSTGPGPIVTVDRNEICNVLNEVEEQSYKQLLTNRVHSPVRTIKPTSLLPRFSILLYGPPNAGKTYAAQTVGMTFAYTLDFDYVEVDQVWLDSFDSTHPSLKKPCVYVTSDTMWHKKFITLYDSVHHKSIFIHTTNRVPRSVSWIEWIRGICSEASWYTKISRMIDSIRDWPRTIDIGECEEGMIRRVGLQGPVFTGSHFTDVSTCSSLEILAAHQAYYFYNENFKEGYDVNSLTPIVWHEYNLFLESIGQIKYIESPSLEATKLQLGREFKEPDITLKASTLSELVWLLGTPRRVVAHLNKDTTPSVLLKPEFLQDQKLGIKQAEPFVIHLPENPSWNEVIEQGIALYDKICQNSNEPSIYISVQDHEIYCYRRAIYTSVMGGDVPATTEWVLDKLKVVEGDRCVMMDKDIVWAICEGLHDMVPTSIPMWAISTVKVQKATVLKGNEMLSYLVQKEKLESLKKMNAWWNMTLVEQIEKVRNSPYWKIFELAFTFISAVGIVVWIWKMSCPEMGVTKCPDTYDDDLLSQILTFYDDPLEDTEDFDEVLQERRQQIANDQDYQRYKEALQKARAAKKRTHIANIRNRARAFKPARGKVQNVLGLPPAHVGKESDREKVVDKILENIVIVRTSAEALDYGCKMITGYAPAMFDNYVFIPAHYYPLDAERKCNPQEASPCVCPFEIEFKQKISVGGAVMLQTIRVCASVYNVKRKLEWVVLEIPDVYMGITQKYNRFKSLLKYVPTPEELLEINRGELMIHKGDHFDRVVGNWHHNIAYGSGVLRIGAIETERYNRCSWMSASMRTEAGMCGLPYLGYANHNRIFCGTHIAAGSLWAFANELDTTIISECMDARTAQTRTVAPDTWIKVSASDLVDDDTPGETRLKEFLLESEKRMGAPISVLGPWIPLLERIDLDCRMSDKAWVSDLVTVCGFLPSLGNNNRVRLRREKTPWAEVVEKVYGPPPKIPSVTSPLGAHSSLVVSVHDKEGLLYPTDSVLWAQLDKSLEQPTKTNFPYISKALELMFPRYKLHYSAGQHRTLNDFEVLNGARYGPYAGFVDGMELDASAGVFMSRTFKGNLKKNYVDVSPDGTKQWKQDIQTCKMLDYLWHFVTEYEDGNIPFSVFKASPKAELVAPKNGISKARLFCAGPMELQYVCMRWFGTFQGAVKRHYSHMPAQIGVDPRHTLWHLFSRGNQIGDQTVCVDFKRWDKLYQLRHMILVSEFIIELILQNFKYPIDSRRAPERFTEQEVRTIMRNIMRSCFASFLLVEGTLIHVNVGNFSGSFFTAILNSFGVESLILGSILLHLEQQHLERGILTAKEFSRNPWGYLEMGTLGDDEVTFLSQALIEAGVCYSSIERAAKAITLTEITPASKGEEVKELQPIEGSEFISRFAKHISGPIWLFALKKESILHLFYWQSTGEEAEEVNMQNLEFIMEEAALHGKEFFEYCKRIADTAVEVAHIFGFYEYVKLHSQLRTYEEYLDHHIEEARQKAPLVPIFQLEPSSSLYSGNTNGYGIDCSSAIPQSAPLLSKQSEREALVNFLTKLGKPGGDMLPKELVDNPYKDCFLNLLYTHLINLCLYLAKQEQPLGLAFYVVEYLWEHLVTNGELIVVDGYRLIYDGKMDYALSFVLQTTSHNPKQFERAVGEVLNVIRERNPEFAEVRYYLSRDGNYYLYKGFTAQEVKVSLLAAAQQRKRSTDKIYNTEKKKTEVRVKNTAQPGQQQNEGLTTKPTGHKHNDTHYYKGQFYRNINGVWCEAFRPLVDKLYEDNHPGGKPVSDEFLPITQFELDLLVSPWVPTSAEFDILKNEQESFWQHPFYSVREPSKEALDLEWKRHLAVFGTPHPDFGGPENKYSHTKERFNNPYDKKFSNLLEAMQYLHMIVVMTNNFKLTDGIRAYMDELYQKFTGIRAHRVFHKYDKALRGQNSKLFWTDKSEKAAQEQNDGRRLANKLGTIELFPRARSDVASSQPTADAAAPQAAPSGVAPMMNTQEDETATRMTFPMAPDGAAFGGAMINVWEVAAMNWMSVYNNGGPVISVPVGTELGHVIWTGNWYTGWNDFHKVLAYMHKRVYPSTQFKINFVGTGTWAGNVFVGITPEQPPTGDVQAADNYRRMFLWVQFSLSEVGAVEAELNRIVNNDQGNPYWNDMSNATTAGPWLSIVLATQYEQALKNEDTAWQVQILSRWGDNVNLYYPDVANIQTMLTAIEGTPDPEAAGVTGNVKQPLRALAGLTWDAVLRAILGQGTAYYPQLVINGSTYRQQIASTFEATGARLLGYGRTTDKNLGRTIKDFHLVLGTVTQNFPDIPRNNTDNFIDALGGFCITNTATQYFRFLGMFSVSGFSQPFLNDLRSMSGWLGSWFYPFSQRRISDITEDIIEELYQTLSDLGYDVTFSTVSYDGVMSADWATGAKSVVIPMQYVRIAKNGVSDIFWIGFKDDASFVPESGSSVVVNGSLTTPDVSSVLEVPVQVLQGSTLPAGMRRLELAFPNPVNSATHIPVSEFLCNCAFRQFLRENCPEGLYTRIDLTLRPLNQKVISILYNRDMDTTMVYVPSTDLQHALFTGGSAEDLQITAILTLSLGTKLPTSDIGAFTSLQIASQASLGPFSTTLARARRRWAGNTAMSDKQQQMINDALEDRLRELGLTTRSTMTAQPGEAQVQGPYSRIRGFQTTTPQDIISKEKKAMLIQAAFMMAGVPAGKMAKGGAKSGGRSSIGSRVNMTTARGPSHTLNGTRKMTPIEQSRNEDQWRDILDRGKPGMPKENQQVIDEANRSNRANNTNFGNEFMRQQRGRRTNYENRAYNHFQMQELASGPSGHKSGANSFNLPKANTTQNVSNRTSHESMLARRKRVQETLRGPGSQRSVESGQYILSRLRSGSQSFRTTRQPGQEQGLIGNAQQHKYDKEMFQLTSQLEKELAGIANQAEIDRILLQAGIDRESAEFQQEFEKWKIENEQEFQKEQTEQEHQNELETLAQKYGLDKELQELQHKYATELEEKRQEHEKELQGSTQEHEKELQGSTQEHEKELQSSAHENTLAEQKQQAELAAAQQRQNQMASGNLTAGLAGVNRGGGITASTLSPTVSSRA